MESALFDTRARTSAMSGEPSRGSSMSLHMLSTMTQQRRLTASVRSLRPRTSTGVITAKAAASTFCTKIQPASSSTHSGTFFASIWALTMVSVNFSRSLLPEHCETFFIATAAFCFTSFLTSFMRIDSK